MSDENKRDLKSTESPEDLVRAFLGAHRTSVDLVRFAAEGALDLCREVEQCHDELARGVQVSPEELEARARALSEIVLKLADSADRAHEADEQLAALERHAAERLG